MHRLLGYCFCFVVTFIALLLVFVFLPLEGTMRFLIRAFGANMP